MLHELSTRSRDRLRAADRPPYPSRAGKRRQPRVAARSRLQPIAARPVSRAVERRLSPRLARAADRRNPRLLWRLRAQSPRKMLARTLAHGFAYQGEPSAHRGGRIRGEPVGSLLAAGLRQFPAEPRPDRQSRARRPAGMVGRRRRRSKRRLRSRCSRRCRRCCSWARNGARRTPFPFFCDFDGDLADAVRNGPAQGVRRGLRDVWRRRAGSAGQRRHSRRQSSTGVSPRSSGRAPAAAGARRCSPSARRRSFQDSTGAAFGTCANASTTAS